jgi:O-antigen/teichoic acid export membrane protein
VVVSAWGSRIVAACSTIYSLRVLSQSLSAPEYAVFVVIVGLAGWFALADLGLGYAAQNAITGRLAEGRSGAGEVLSAYLMLMLATSLLVLALYVFRHPIAATLFGKLLAPERQGGDTFFRSALILVGGASFAMSTKVLYAMHRGYVANAVAAFAPVVGVGLLVLGISSADDKVTYAVVALHGPNALTCCALAIQQIARAARERPSLPRETFQKLAKASGGFLAFNALGAAVLQIDYLVMSQKVGPVEIIQYYTTGKIFSFIAFFNQAVLFATWPTLTALYSTGDLPEIRRHLRRLMLLSSGVTLAATTAVLIAQDHLGAFLAPGTALDLRGTVILGFGAVTLIRCLTDPFAIFLQSIGKLTPLIVCAAVQAMLSASLQWVLVDAFSIEGILLALLLSFVLTSAWALPLASRKLLSDGRTPPKPTSDTIPEPSR